MMSVVMVGAGGTGSHLIHPLLQWLDAIDEHVVHVWDADMVEQKNLTRQLFWSHEIGKNKAQCFEDRWPRQVVSHQQFISEENVEKAIQNEDVVLICADNMAVRRLINERAKKLESVIVINGGNELHTGSVQVFARHNNKNVTPSLDFFSPEFKAVDDGADPATMSCAEIAQLPGGEQSIMANNTVAAFMLQALHRAYEADVYSQDKQWTKLTFDIMAGTVQTSDVRLIGGLDD